MNLAGFLLQYAGLNLLVAVAPLVLWLIGLPLNFRSRLKAHYVGLVGVVLLTMALPFIPRWISFEAPAKIWSSDSPADFARGEARSVVAIGRAVVVPSVQAEQASKGLLLIWLAIGLALIAGLWWNVRVLSRIRRAAIRWRRFGRVSIYFSARVQVPLAFRLGREAIVIVPYTLSIRARALRLALAHELQHHRQGDTTAAFGIWILRGICFANPLVHIWNWQISQLQEMACDEALVSRQNVDSQEYARCLVEVAELAVDHGTVPVCAAGFYRPGGGRQFKRRIHMLFRNPTNDSIAKVAGAFVVLVGVMSATAFAAKNLVQDRRISRADAEVMLRRVQATSSFPVEVNEFVLAELNRFLGSEEGRAKVRRTLANMQKYESMIASVLQTYNAPRELLAVPFVESGYTNPPQSANPSNQGAGLWQFIPSTARRFGMRVDQTVDERLNESIATDGALRYLLSNRYRFNDWRLSLLAYNAGENRVQSGIDELGTSDAWALIRSGFQGDRGYLARVMAAVLILRNPEALQ